MHEYEVSQLPELPELPELFNVWQESLDWVPNALQQAQFQQLYQLILAANRQFNLTRITAPDEFWEKHLWDSLWGIKPFLSPQNLEGLVLPGESQDPLPIPPAPLPLSSLPSLNSLKAIDIGTGGGFPGIPIAIAQPDWEVLLLDSTRKKINFLHNLVGEMGLSRVFTGVDRAESWGQHPQYREQYDLATIRAVATAAVCAEYALPLLKVGGLAVLYRGQWTEAEADGLQQAVEQLGGTIAAVEAGVTPLSQSIRHCVYLRKLAPTSRLFPRPVGMAVQQPLAPG
jgi:16S rRNA (guanine527-N7)-methyltransferase